MFSDDDSKYHNNKGILFIKKVKETDKNTSHANHFHKDYKILLALCMIYGLPFSPYQLIDNSRDNDMSFITFMSLFFNILRTVICMFSMSYTHHLFPFTSLVLTFNSCNMCFLIVSWCLFLKRHKIVKAMRLILTLSSQVYPSKFRSKWNILVFILIHIIGFASISTSLILLNLEDSRTFNVTAFLSNQIPDEYNYIFTRAIGFSSIFTFSYGACVCGIVMVMNSTMYFHLGDIIFKFSNKLKTRFQNVSVTQHSLAENLEIFRKILHLTQSINEAVSVIVVFFYGATICTFFNAICSASFFSSTEIKMFILISSIFLFGIAVFFIVTLTGDRVKCKYKVLQDCLIECSSLIIKNSYDEKIITSFSLICQNTNAADLCVTGGNMFVISNSFISTVAGVLLTYGVLIFQMDAHH